MPMYDVQKGDVRACSFLEQRAIRSATALTSCSGYLSGEVRSTMGIRSRIDVIPNGIDLNLFDQQESGAAAATYGFPKDKLTILFAGRMERRKGIHLCGAIAQAILRKHDVSFVFAGQDLFGYMKDTLLPSLNNQQLRGSVHYLGKLDMPGVRSCLRTADIFLLPSLWENCPYSCLEAMAAGRGVVSSDQGGMPELIQDGINGLLARSEVPESHAEQLERLITDGNLRLRLGAAARRTVEQNYTDDRVARLSLEAYERAISAKKRFKQPLAPDRS
jgi:glycosyltransferase involved in cell wall biosynthesis